MITTPPTWDEFERALLSRYLPPLRAKTTHLMMSQALREMRPHCPTAADLTEDAVNAFVASQPADRSHSRTEALLRCIRVAANFARAKPRQWIPASPFEWRPLPEWVRAIRSPRPKKLVKTAAEIGRLLTVLDRWAAGGSWRAGRLRALAYVYAYTGLRAQEAIHVVRRNVDLERRVLTVEPLETPVVWRPKTVRSARTLPIAPALWRVLVQWEPLCGASEWLFPGRWGRSPWKGARGYTPLDGLRQAAAEAKIGDVTIIAIRRTIATLSPAWGIDPEFRRQLLGHTDVLTSQTWYVQREVELLRAGAVDRIAYGPDRPAEPTPPAGPSLRLYVG